MPRKVDRIGSDSAPDLENLLASPSLELSESRNVWLHEILTCLNLIEVLFCSHRRWGMPQITWSRVPIIAHPRNPHIDERHNDLREAVTYRLNSGSTLSGPRITPDLNHIVRMA